MWYRSTLLRLWMYVQVLCLLVFVAFEYNIVFFREGLDPEGIWEIQGQQEGWSVISYKQNNNSRLLWGLVCFVLNPLIDCTI